MKHKSLASIKSIYGVLLILLSFYSLAFAHSPPSSMNLSIDEMDNEPLLSPLSTGSDDNSAFAANATFQNLGTMIQAHNRGTFYASHSSVFKDESGSKFHTFYCSSVKPFVQNEGPGWDTNETNTFYAADAVRYESIDAKTLKSQTGAMTYLVGALEFKPKLGLNTIKMAQSPCTSSTVKFRDQYYTFFESFSDGSQYGQMVGIHVARSKTPGGNSEVLTTEGWKPLRSTKVPWKPIIKSFVFNDYPKYQRLINLGVQAARENWGANSHGNYLWGMGVPSAVVRDGKIYVLGWDNIYFPDTCRLEKINNRWQVPPNVRCGRSRIVTSADGENFVPISTPDFTPNGDIKLVNDPRSEQNGNFAFFWTYINEDLKAQQKVGLSVSFATPDFKGWSPAYNLGLFPSRASASTYYDLGGILSPRVAGNAYGEIAPTSEPTLLQMALPRTAAYSKPTSIAENREIYAWYFQLSPKLAMEAPPVQVGDPGQAADAPVVPTIVTGLILADSSNRHSLNVCGNAFTNLATVRVKWNHQSSDIWYTPTSNTNRAIHYIGTIPTANNHPPFCIMLPLKPEEVNYLKNGNTASVQIHQISNNSTSAPFVFKASDLPGATPPPPPPPPPPAAKPFKIMSPTQGLKNVNLNPNIEWKADNSKFAYFMIELSDQKTFKSFWNHQEAATSRKSQYFGLANGWGKGGTNPTDPPEKLLPNTFYWIRIAAFDEKGKKLRTTAVIKFKTGAN